MPWQEVDTMTLRREFVVLAKQGTMDMTALCRGFGISRKTGYKWLTRDAPCFDTSAGPLGLADRSRRPRTSPAQTGAPMEACVVERRQAHPAWGGRKIRRRLQDLGQARVPAASTITAILHRHGLVSPEASAQHQAFKRFEQAYPNALWQMDFKGHFAPRQGRCHPLTVLDDHSRFNIVLAACGDETTETVQALLTAAFRRYGLPERMTMDNGSPWGADAQHELTPLTVWLIRLGVGVSHSRPYHPQTQGKDERFHRTLALEVLRGRQFEDLGHCQRHFDRFREVYNLDRPHEALGMLVPVKRYQPSPRPFPEALPAIDYAPGDHVRRVQAKGEFSFQGRTFRVRKALRGYPIALRPTDQEGCFGVWFCHKQVAAIDLRTPIG